MAAEHFLPPGRLKPESVMGATFGSPRLMQSRNQHSSVRRGHTNLFPGGDVLIFL